jgi:hypothetical protein
MATKPNDPKKSGGEQKKFGATPTSFDTAGHHHECAPVKTCCLTVTDKNGDPVAHVGSCPETGEAIFEFKKADGCCLCLTATELQTIKDKACDEYDA